MALAVGLYKAEILQNDLREIADKTAASLQVRTEDGDVTEVLIFITEKSAGIARASLKIAGFDVDANDLSLLAEDPNHLAGAIIPILVEEYNGRLRAQIVLKRQTEKAKASKLSGMLRDVKRRAVDMGDEAPPPSDPDIPF